MKRNLFLLWAILAMVTQGYAQDSLTLLEFCGFSPRLMYEAEHTPDGHKSLAAASVPPGFPASAIQTCGKFKLYYQDVALPIPAGFNDPVEGATRRSTLCAVLNYYESVLDFSKVPDSGIRILVDTSFCAYYPVLGRNIVLGTGYAFFDTGATPGDTLNGFAWDYIKSGSDPSAGHFHGRIQINFDSITNAADYRFTNPFRSNDYQPVSWNSGLDSPLSCEYDLASYLTHVCGHVMGWFSWYDNLEEEYRASNVYTNIDLSLRNSNDPHSGGYSLSFTRFIDAPGSSKYIWLNDRQPPYNHAVSDRPSHLQEYDYIQRSRISPGDLQDQVMGNGVELNRTKRRFSKIEIETFKNIIGYDLNPTFSGTVSGLLANHTPWSSKMSFAYSPNYDSLYFSELLTADFTLQNNIGSSITIDLMADTTLKDVDGDSIRVLPGSLVNFRGCGEGGNNHNSLSVDPSGTKITYTPRPNFFGRATFGFNLYDSKEKGSFVIYTIDVTKGSNVSFPSGSNLVMNGNFEEGTEVRRRLYEENVNNSRFEKVLAVQGRFVWGNHFADGHSFLHQVAIHNSYNECSYPSLTGRPFGDFRSSFPWATGVFTWGGPVYRLKNPDSSVVTGQRYQLVTGSGIYMLGDTLKKCKRYRLEFDANRTFRKGLEKYYKAIDSIEVGFSSYISYKGADNTSLIRKLKTFAKRIDTSDWTHVCVDFTYCSDTPATALFMNILRMSGTGLAVAWFAPMAMDNLSIKEIGLQAEIEDTYAATEPCKHTLRTGSCTKYGCDSMSYQWRKLGSSTILATSDTFNINAYDSTYYTLTMSDGCNVARDTILVLPCACGPGKYFGTGAYSVISGTYSGSGGSGNYFVDDNLTLSADATFSNAIMLIQPNVAISVQDTRKLTLNGCHLLTCPTENRLWKGITLESSATSSAHIKAYNNTLIEDAVNGIYAHKPYVGGSGYVIETEGAIFNRNQTGITIDSISASSPAVYPFRITNTIFTSRMLDASGSGYPFSWPTAASLRNFMISFTGATPPFHIDTAYEQADLKSGSIPLAGLRLLYVGNTAGSGSSYSELVFGDGSNGTYTNLFDNTGDGISGTNSNLTVFNTVFLRMRKPIAGILPSGLPLPSGAGINLKASPDVLYARLQVLDSVGSNTTLNEFYDCQTGIYGENYWQTTIRKSKVQTSNTSASATHTGFRILSAKYNEIMIDGNRLYNVPNGIVVNSTTSVGGYIAGNVRVKKNKLYAHPFAPVAYNASHFMRQGIVVNASVFSASGIVTKVSYIDSNELYDVYNGISVSNNNKLRAYCMSNLVDMVRDPGASGTAPQYGIYYANNLNPVIRANNVYTDAGSDAADGDNVRAFYTTANTGLYMLCNTATRTGRGFDFTGTQPLTKWVSNTMDNNLKGFALGGAIGSQVDYTNSAWPFWKLPGGWGSGHYQTYAYYPSSTSPIYAINITTVAYTNKPTNNFGTFLAYFYDFTSGSLKYGGLFGPDPCWTILPNEPIPAKSSLIKLIKSNTLSFRREAAAPEIWMAQEQLWRSSSVDSAISDSTMIELDSFRQFASGSRYEWLGDIENALADGDVPTASTLISTPVPALGYLQVDTNLVITDSSEASYIVNNYLDFYSLYTDYLEGYDIDSDLLVSLCYLCPFDNGRVVYQARALYEQLYGYNGPYDDDDLCNIDYSVSRLAPPSVMENQYYTLYPSPNDGNLKIRQLVRSEDPVRISVYNSMGALIYATSVTFSNTATGIHLGAIPAGLYVLALTEQNGRNFNIKFSVK